MVSEVADTFSGPRLTTLNEISLLRSSPELLKSNEFLLALP